MAEKLAKEKVVPIKQDIISPKREADTVMVASTSKAGASDADSHNQMAGQAGNYHEGFVKKAEDSMDIDDALAGQPMDDTAWQESATEQMGPSRTARPLTTSASEPTGERVLNVNDAMTYLDAIKKQFAGNQDVYNEFLNIMKDFKIQSIDTPGVIWRVSQLFFEHPALIEGFNTFLPEGYRIECSLDAHDVNVITVTTPAGETMQSRNPDSGAIAGPSNAPSTTLFPENFSYTQEEMSPALEYVQKIRQRFAEDEDQYLEFLDILNSYKRKPVDQEQLAARIHKVFKNAPDLLAGLQNYFPIFNNLDYEPSIDREAKGGRQGKKKAAEAGTSGPPKRKRKPVDRDKEREKERERERERERESEVAMKASQSKKQKPHHGISQEHFQEDGTLSVHRTHGHGPTSQHPRDGPSGNDLGHASRKVPSADDMLFFDRVRAAIDNRDVYNEFLKLINLFSQEIIDLRTLVDRSRSFLGDELLVQFKNILGWDASWDENIAPNGIGVHIAGQPAGLERPSRETLSIQNGPSYRRLPASEANVACSGRDDMCKSVLNDEWVCHPTWASEDSGFVAHRKNVYEEALHRSEEERHEYDYHIEALTKTITSLQQHNKKILQMSPEERLNYKTKMPMTGVNKAVHQRILKKIYGRDAGLEVMQAILDNPGVAIPIVMVRLSQKEEEWKRAQREWNKVWREVDARNYQKSLDHQGINFKANDKKAIQPKALVNQIESVRSEQMSKRAALIDPLFARTRPRYQMAFIIEDTSVLQDVAKLAFSYLDRMSNHMLMVDRRRIEGFLKAFIPLFFMLNYTEFNASFRDRYGADLRTTDVASFIEELDEPTPTGNARNGRRRGNGNDLRKKILKNNAQDKTGIRRGRTNGTMPSNLSESQDASAPVASSSVEMTEPIANGVQEQEGQDAMVVDSGETPEKKIRRGSFFCNTHFYVLLRLVELLYSRLLSLKGLSAKLANDPSSPYVRGSLAAELVLMNNEPPDRKLAELRKSQSPASQFYPHLLEACERLFDNEIDQQTFEEIVRYMFGIKAYTMFTIDKVLAAIIKQVQAITSEGKSLPILDGLKRERELDTPAVSDLDDIRANVEKAIGPDENLFRIDWAPSSSTITVQLLGKDDGSFDDYDIFTGRWQNYIDSYVSDEITRGLADAKLRPPFLQRNLRSVKKQSPTPGDFQARSGLEIKVCVRTYRMFFVADSEDFMWKSWSATDLRAADERAKSQVAKSRRWLERFDKEAAIPR